MTDLFQSIDRFPGKPLHPQLEKEWKAFLLSQNKQKLLNFLKPALQIQIEENGDVSAAKRMDVNGDDPTHYDAVWVRDALWVYRKEKLDNPSEAKKILWRQINYFSHPHQIERFECIIQNPKRAKDGMRVPHIRYQQGATDYRDVQVNAEDQFWNHKQNDALGFFYQEFVDALMDQRIRFDDLSDRSKKLLLLMPIYFDALEAWAYEDSGPWEEIDQNRSSSLALLTSAMIKLETYLKTFRQDCIEICDEKTWPSIKEFYSQKKDAIILKKLKTSLEQKISTGEAGDYPLDDYRHRKSDAALLHLLYPCELDFLTTHQKNMILHHLIPLIGEKGIRRYILDSYQSKNFWKNGGLKHSGTEQRMTEASDRKKFLSRAKNLQYGDEAQWFFDSWLSIALSKQAEANEKDAARLKEYAKKTLYRALCQLTPGQEGHPSLLRAADGSKIPGFSLPESYTPTSDHEFLPSPICPLNWAKASARIAIEAL